MLAQDFSVEKAFAVSQGSAVWIQNNRVVQTDSYAFDSMIADIAYRLWMSSNLRDYIEDIRLGFSIITVDGEKKAAYEYNDVLTSAQPIHPELRLCATMSWQEIKNASDKAKLNYGFDLGAMLSIYVDFIDKLYGILDLNKVVVKANSQGDLCPVIFPERMGCFSSRHMATMADIPSLLDERKHDPDFRRHNTLCSALKKRYGTTFMLTQVPIIPWDEYAHIYSENTITAVKYLITGIIHESVLNKIEHTSHF